MNASPSFPPQPNYPIPPAPRPARVWSPGFISAIILIALLSGILALFGVSAMAQNPNTFIDFYPGNFIYLIFWVGLLSACLAALWFVPDWLLRAGLLLQVGIALVEMFDALINNQVIRITFDETSYSSFFFSLGLIESALDLLSLICLSYGLARWQRSDRIALPVQILLTLGLGVIVVGKIDSTLLDFTVIAIGQVCATAAIFVLLARPVCWRAAPLITACFTVFKLLSLLYSTFAIGPHPRVATPQPFQILYTLGFATTIIFLLGVVLLAQTERVKAAASKPLPFQPPYPPPAAPAWEPPPTSEKKF